MTDWRAHISCRPGEWPVYRDSALLHRLVSEVRRLDESGASDDEVAGWLKARTVCCGESSVVMKQARGTEWDPWETATWREAATGWQLSIGGKSFGSLHSPDGPVYEIGDVLGLGREHAPPHRSCQMNMGWRVIGVVEADDPAFKGRLILEPFNDSDA